MSNIQVFTRTGNTLPHERTIFKGGEVNVQLERIFESSVASVDIRASIRCSDDVMELLLITDALRRQGWEEIHLRMHYVPYARQDRVCNPGESLSIKVFCDLINAQSYRSVEVWDVHSDVTLALLNNVVHFEAHSLIPNWALKYRPILVAPDAGAIKKVEKIATNFKCHFVRADKTRNTQTGEVSGAVVYSEHVGSEDFLIIDDICDGGRTFINLAQELRKLTTGNIMLYVTHGIFSYGTEVFDGVLDYVFVANSWLKDLPSNFNPTAISKK